MLLKHTQLSQHNSGKEFYES